MWKLIVGFLIFAAIAIFVLTKSGGDIDLGGEKHDVGSHGSAPASAAAEPASAATPAASAASQ